MPELPDLRVYSENIKKLVLDKRIEETTVYSPKNIDCDKGTIATGIMGGSVSDVTAEGKELFLWLDNGDSVGVHLMLNGMMHYITKDQAATVPNKVIGITFDDGNSLLVSDFQKFCKIRYNPDKSDVPDVLSLEFTLEYFLSKADQFKRKKIKAFLLDQKIMRGIGNAYADEILWKAKISPKSVTGKIPKISQEMLYITIKSVLLWAIGQIKRVNPEMISGEERKFMQVHNPRFKYTKDKERIHIETISSKKTYYTDSQVHYY